MKLKMLKGEYVVVKLPFDFQIPEQILKFDFYNLSRTSDELSLVIRNDENYDYNKFEYEDNWSIFRLGLEMTRILIPPTIMISFY